MAWYNTNFLNRKKFTILHSKVTGSQVNIPLYFQVTDAALKTVANGGKVRNANGWDVVFTLGETALLNYEIEKYDGAAGSIWVWIGIASLSNTADTVLYMYYNNSTISTSQENKNALWVSMTDHIYVHHMQTVTDSTGKGHNFAFHGTTLIAGGMMDGCQQFTGSSGSYLNINTSSDQNVSTNGMTVSTWAYSNADWSSNNRVIVSRNQYNICSNNGNIHFGVFVSGGAERWVEVGLPSANVWHKYDMVFNNGVLTAYIDGASAISYTGSNVPIQASNDTLYIAQRSGLANSTGWNGYIDETRLTYDVRLSSYLATQFTFERNGTSCYTLAAEEAVGTIGHRNAMGRENVIGRRTRNATGRLKLFAPTTTSEAMGRIYIKSASKHGMGRMSMGSQFVYAYDAFNRANNSTSWGVTNYNNIPWYRVAGVGKTSISNNVGFLKYGGNANDTIMSIGTATLQNAEIKVKMRLGSNGGEQMGLVFRYLDPNNYYKFTTGYTRNTSYFWSRKAGKWSAALLTMSTPANVGDWVWVKARYYGSTFSFKFWHDGTPEPLNWQWTKTDTALTAAGRYCLAAVPAVSSSGVSFDYIEVDPLTTKRNATGRINFKQAFPSVWSASGRMNVVNQTATYNATGRLDLDITPKPSPVGLFVAVGAFVTPILLDSISIVEHVNQRTTVAFSVRDDVIYALSQEQAISIYAYGVLLFAGFVDTITTDHLQPSTTRLHAITGKDTRYLADKLIYPGPEYSNWLAGDVACDLIDNQLKYEGVTGVYAKDTDKDALTFSQGQLTNMDTSTGALQLAAAGADVSILESTTADFSTGTLTNALALNDNLAPISYAGMAMSGVALGGANVGATGAPNIYNYYKIWRGAVTLATNDYFDWYTWVSTISPVIIGGVDFLFSDGSALRTQGVTDQYGVSSAPSTSLQGYADDQWYHRKCVVPSALNGKQIVACMLALEGDVDGDYIFYTHDINLYNASGVLKQSFAQNTSQQVSNVGYARVVVKPVTVYLDNAVRVSPAYDVSGIGIAKNSFISWTEVDTAQPTGKGTYDAQVVIEMSVNNGATWAICTNHTPIPTVLPGQSMAGRTAFIRQTLNIGGPDPTLAPVLSDCQFTMQSAPASPKIDVWTSEVAGGMGTGALNMLTNGANGLYMTGAYKTWDDADVTTGQTLFGASNPAVSCYYGQLALRTDASSDCRVQFNFAGQHQNFVAELDVNLTVAGCENGFVYRTTYWANANDTYGYGVKITSTQIVLIKGANGPTAGWSAITTVSHTFTVGNWYRLKVVVFGNRHRVFMDDILYIDSTDATFPGTGYIGARIYNGSAARNSAYYDNFGVQDITSQIDYATGSRISTPVILTDPNPIQDSYISWDADVPTGTSLDIQISTDNGATYASCTNFAQIPGLTPGLIAATKSVILKTLMNSNNPTVTPLIRGLSWKVLGQYVATGTRISPPLDITPVGRVGNTSIAWDSDSPDGTSIQCATSLNSFHFDSVGSGDEIVGIDAQPDLVEDAFDDPTAAINYTTTHYTGGIAPTVTRDTTAKTLTLSGGSQGLYTWDVIDEMDCMIEATLNFSDNGGLVARYRDVDNHNRLMAYDDANGSRTPMIVVTNRVAGNDSEYSVIPIDFVRGTYHTVQWELDADTMNVSWDGVQLASLPNNALTTDGKVGFYNDTGTSVWNNSVVRGYGDDVTGERVWSMVTMTTTDPTVTPVMRELTVAARGPNIIAGDQLDQTSYTQNSVASALDDIAGQSNAWWKIGNKDGELLQLFLMERETVRAPWPLATVNGDLLYAQPKVVHQSSKYRNRQYITGAIDHTVVPETKRGDGITQSWSLSYPVDEIESVTVNNVPATFGLKDKATGVNFYYSVGSNTFAQDAAASPVVDGQKIVILYKGQVPYTAMKEDQAAQKQLALISKTTGIVAVSENVPGISKSAADALAQSRLDEYCILSRDWTFTTQRSGLQPGQSLLVYVPEMGIPVGNFYIIQVRTTIYQQSDGTLFYFYDVDTSEGPDIGSWTKWFNLIS